VKNADASVPAGESGALPLPPDVSPVEVRAQLDKILRSEQFAHAESLSHFLRFIVEYALQGQGGQLKEYRIGVEVFGRGDDFDPKEDTIVRVQARNLRSRLRAYYDSAPTFDRVSIVLPTGTYLPVFRSRQSPLTSRTRFRYVYVLISAGLVISHFLVYHQAHKTSAPVSPARLLVTGFSAGATADPQYYAKGFAAAMVCLLRKSGTLHVVQLGRRTAVLPSDAIRLGQQFHVAAVLTGTVMRRPPKLQVKLELFDSTNGSLIWHKLVDGDEQQVLRIQEDIANTVLAKMHAGHLQVRAIRTPVDPAVYDLYLQSAAANLQESSTREQTRRSLEAALVKVPNFAPLYAQLARVHGAAYSNNHLPESLRQAQWAAGRALRLDPTLGEAHVWAGQVAEKSLDWDSAGQHYQQAVRLEPGLAPARYFYAVLLARLGRTDRALDEAHQYQEQEPLAALGLEGWIVGLQRQYDRAIALLRKAHEQSPADVYASLALGDFYLQQGEFDQAIRVFEAARFGNGEEARALGHIGLTHGLAGRPAEARQVLRQLLEMNRDKPVPPTAIAVVHAGLGDRDAAFQWLEKAATDDLLMLTYLKMDPIYDSLRADPRYFALLKKLKLN
jgi:serine/threonine-protein kinase